MSDMATAPRELHAAHSALTRYEDLECWFLTGSQTLYCDETLRQVANQSKTIAQTLNSAAGAPIPTVWKPVLIDAESIPRPCLEADASDRCVGVIAWMHTFSPAK